MLFVPEKAASTCVCWKENGINIPVNSAHGIYLLFSGSQCVYAGESKQCARRVAEHENDRLKAFDSARWFPVLDREARFAESWLIWVFLPKYNQRISYLGNTGGRFVGRLSRETTDSICQALLLLPFHYVAERIIAGIKTNQERAEHARTIQQRNWFVDVEKANKKVARRYRWEATDGR